MNGLLPGRIDRHDLKPHHPPKELPVKVSRADLVLLHPNGAEEVLVPVKPHESIADPFHGRCETLTRTATCRS
jgi:hypothetical protein